VLGDLPVQVTDLAVAGPDRGFELRDLLVLLADAQLGFFSSCSS
jgi:hypothetical protein